MDKILEPIPLQPKQKITIYSISSAMATTTQDELTVTRLMEPEFKSRFASQNPTLDGDWWIGVGRRYRKRDEIYICVNPSKDIIVPGWGNVQTDVEAFGSFIGNACINLSASPDEIKELLAKNLNPHFAAHDLIMSAEKPWTEGDYIPVYPETPSTHAVVEQLRNKQEQ